jgi:hypothetical protein
MPKSHFLACLLLGFAPPAAVAVQVPQDSPPDITTETPASDTLIHSAPASSDHVWHYSIGLRWRVDDVGLPAGNGSFRPMLGLRYGRWRLGSSTGDDWLRTASFLRISNVEYQWMDTGRTSVGLSARIQNLEDNAGFDGFAGGRNTVRARAHVVYRLTPRWSLDGAITQDLLLRGDGSTLTAGLSYLWPLGEHSSLGLSAGMTWATATHLRSRYREMPVPENGWQAGAASLGGGLSWRYSISPQWAWFATLGTTRPLGQLHQVSPSAHLWNGQLGLLYFSH